ncbi:MinD/ParA family protein [Paenibacillus sp. N1-5-1-14]|uniref:MinD/ParA family protein n=1 Tax=Paenibacillus radicibacter TaxID=2972488 RepID=UPI002158AC62|nr:MinD/ParA family protein [Paenibacillus radicibacter]MCR8642173.1 MinD/ParA family protein [Paenibacillus radicibacter]
MNDQAQTLRNLVQIQGSSEMKRTRVLTVTSGKGGVGKSNFTLNLALALQAKGLKVLIFDADLGMSNIDVLMGLTPQYNLYHLLKRQKTIWDIIQKGTRGIEFISGGSGFNDLLSLSEEELDYFTNQVDQLNGYADYIIFDTGAGLSKETLKFILAAEQTIIVTTPEPPAITDAYALIKMVHTMGHKVSFKLVINRVTDYKEGKQTADKIRLVAEQFLNLNISSLGYIDDDTHVSKAVKQQIPFTIAYPNCGATRSIHNIASGFISGQSNVLVDSDTNGVKGIIGKIFRFMQK